MTHSLLGGALQNILSAPILFFILGFTASLLKSDLHIPEAVGKGLSIFFMMAIGFKGGVELAKTGLQPIVMYSSGIAILFGLLIPVAAFYILRKVFALDTTNSGAIAAHYGSVSVVTFVTCVAFLERSGIFTDGFMVGMMALMESPAILMALLLVRMTGDKGKENKSMDLKEVLSESLLNSSVVILTGSLLIGFITGEKGSLATKPFFVDPFYGILSLFLLDMGTLAARRIGEFRTVGPKLLLFAFLFPVLVAIPALLAARAIGLPEGSAVLFATLCASASYIAAPAAVRLALPAANPSYYLTMSLALTFPFNITIGIPVYLALAGFIYGTH